MLDLLLTNKHIRKLLVRYTLNNWYGTPQATDTWKPQTAGTIHLKLPVRYTLDYWYSTPQTAGTIHPRLPVRYTPNY